MVSYTPCFNPVSWHSSHLSSGNTTLSLPFIESSWLFRSQLWPNGDRSNKGMTESRTASSLLQSTSKLHYKSLSSVPTHSFIYSLQHLSYPPPAVISSPVKLAKSNFTVNPTVYPSRWFKDTQHRCIIWGSVSTGDRGIVVSSVCDGFDLILLNMGVFIHLCLGWGGSFTLDLAFYSQGLGVHLEQPLLPDLHNNNQILHISTTFPLEYWHLN
jgi:hypothetical protein